MWVHEQISVAKIENVLHLMGHQYEALAHGEGFTLLDCKFPSEGGEYELVFDESQGDMLLTDVLDQLESAGVDRSAFLTLLDTI